MESPLPRILAGSIVLILLVTLCIYYANEHDLKYSSYENIHSQGALVSVHGTVGEAYKGGFIVVEYFKDQPIIFYIQSSDPPPPLYSAITIIGVLGPNNQITSIQKIDITEASDYRSVLLRSFLALIFLIYIFHRYWYFDPGRFEFRRR